MPSRERKTQREVGQKMDNELIIIDTDPGTDDSVAIALLQQVVRPAHVAFVSTYGTMSLNVTHANLRKVLSLFPGFEGVYMGSASPLARPPHDCGGLHGPDGLGGQAECIEDTLGDDSGGLAELARLMKRFDSCVYVCMGPLTNLAKLVLQQKSPVEKIREALIVGGGFEVTTMRNRCEFNFEADALADSLVLSKSLKKVLFPLDFTYGHVLKQEHIDGLPQDANAVIRKILEANYESGKDRRAGGAALNAAFPMLYLKDREAFETTSEGILVDGLGSVYTSDAGHKIEIVTGMRDGLLIDALTQLFGEE